MFKLAALSALVAGAAAFAPAQQGASSTALMAFESEVCTGSPRYFLFGGSRHLRMMLNNINCSHKVFLSSFEYFIP